MKLRITLIIWICLIMSVAQAQIWPIPQSVQTTPGSLTTNAVKLKSNIKLDEVNLNLVKRILPLAEQGKNETLFKIQYFKKGASENKGTGTYKLEINPKTITLSVADQRAIFYGLRTLSQIIQKQSTQISIPLQTIFDYADVSHRGVVEGFYGTPWSFEDRIEQLRYYGDLKLNTYIYGPKDDPYHSSPHWRDEYPSEKAKEIQQLVNEANKNYVDFVWAIHPGKDIKWNKTDSVNLLHKFEKMYALGVRAFAVFFDDIGGEGTNPTKQADLLNYLHNEFVKKYKDVNPLIVCPTEYNKSWSNPKPGTYLDILGDKLDPSIQVMWTGNRVIADIDMPTLEWINKRLKRKAYIWWNFPVSDYVRNHLLMGPAYGNALDIAQDISGFVSNPMERAEASKIALYGVAGYTWNMKKYDSEQAFHQATEYLMPEAAESFRIFAENNSDLGPNGHGYRRTETVQMQPSILALEKSFPNPSNELLTPVINYFDSIVVAPIEIKNKAINRRLINEITPWLNQFELLGKSGQIILNAYKNIGKTSPSQQWDSYLATRHQLDKMKQLNQQENQNPYQPGVATGSLVLHPFVINALNLFGNRFLLNTNSQNQPVTQEKLLTNIPQIQNQAIQSTDKSIAISPAFEPIKLAPKAYVGLSWLDNRIAQQLNFNFDSNHFNAWGTFEISKDGINWEKFPNELNNKAKNFKLNPTTFFVRFINQSDSTQQIYLKQFSVQTKENTESTNLNLLRDNNLATSVTISPKQVIKITLNGTNPVKLLLDTYQQELALVGTRQQQLYKGTENYITLSTEKLKGIKEIEIKNPGELPIKIYEIQQP